jgi:hypothetical protein
MTFARRSSVGLAPIFGKVVNVRDFRAAVIFSSIWLIEDVGSYIHSERREPECCFKSEPVSKAALPFNASLALRRCTFL